ncbi:MAG: 30S ribosomal protein S15 [Candidatus Marsarchaeota archaeon]|jgi:small subunit ribosomal protein S15|nr:30S ribosomal protein S15 [Candidatus Marsarchaeota archaeon]MCL5418867.1 30S ribosomal protein S15 [Candidatus Marsarchaeota archaeon]
MARIHSKKKGKSKSRKPPLEKAVLPEAGKEKIEDIIINYAKQGMSPALIGEKLKKEHNVPYIKHAMGKRLGKILEEKGMAQQLPPDMLDLMRKAVNMRAHLAANKGDTYNKIRLHNVESKIWRLTRYYIRKNRLPQGWRYNPATAELLIKGKV